MRRKQLKYTGDLARPITIKRRKTPTHRLSVARALWPIEESERVEREIGEEIERRLALLLKIYGVHASDSHRWHRLARCLAVNHVPGFRATDSPGRRTTRDDAALLGVYLAVEEQRQAAQKKNQRLSIARICAHLTKKTGKSGGKLKAKTLQMFYVAAHRSEHVKSYLRLRDHPDDPRLHGLTATWRHRAAKWRQRNGL